LGVERSNVRDRAAAYTVISGEMEKVI
jgi:hypothetical protein